MSRISGTTSDHARIGGRLLTWEHRPPQGARSPMNRDEKLARYRHLRAINKRQQTGALDCVSRAAMLDCARRLGLARGRTLILDDPDEMTLVFDLVVHAGIGGRSRAIDRYADKVRPPSRQRRRARADRNTECKVHDLGGGTEACDRRPSRCGCCHRGHALVDRRVIRVELSSRVCMRQPPYRGRRFRHDVPGHSCRSMQRSSWKCEGPCLAGRQRRH